MNVRALGRLSLARERGRVRVYELEGAVPNPSPQSSPLSEGRGVAPIRNQQTRPRTGTTHLNAKIVFQSFFMLMTVQPFFFAVVKGLGEVPTFVSGNP